MTRTLLVAAVGLVLVAAGCGTDAEPETGPTATPSSPSPVLTSATPTTTALLPEQAVHEAALIQADVEPGFGADEMRHGDTVDGQVTLALCGASFPSESRRIARHQVGFPGAGHDWVSNEVVAYDEGGVDQALGEVRAAIAACPEGFRPSGIAEVPDTRYRFTPLPDNDRWLPGTLAYLVETEPEGGQTVTSAWIFQHHDRLLSILYVYVGDESATLATTLAGVAASRLVGITVAD